ncbi:hypothetical protein A2450_02255 [candidate division WWE3 bacterium RIFOXYC2_FULL_40_11]|nr:MAG: hypothetical protein A2450_02255 [candidate division WWE3 bacterium RIFOXYC2_FULL_40_11]OGC70302.1 MAG: hypothetical protein A2602_04505 [candidate division WWE3 bacterium RIFOXYD1_FULL_40_11]HLD51594.1 hypothetical protein [Patescibacteria group bacterium]
MKKHKIKGRESVAIGSKKCVNCKDHNPPTKVVTKDFDQKVVTATGPEIRVWKKGDFICPNCGKPMGRIVV